MQAGIILSVHHRADARSVTIENRPLSPIQPQLPSADAFRQAAARTALVQVTLDGSQWEVKGVGTLPGSQRPVMWVEGEVDTASVFVASLQNHFSAGISRAVARELDLQPSPGIPLSSRKVTQALDMADASHAPLAGVDYMTQLDLSASSQGDGFRRVCEALGVSAASLGIEQRAAVDARMAESFGTAAAHGGSPVPRDTALQWLREALAIVRA